MTVGLVMIDDAKVKSEAKVERGRCMLKAIIKSSRVWDVGGILFRP